MFNKKVLLKKAHLFRHRAGFTKVRPTFVKTASFTKVGRTFVKPASASSHLIPFEQSLKTLVCLVTLLMGALSQAKDYENFDLPKSDHKPVKLEVDRMNYKTNRFSLTAKRVSLKDSSYSSQDYLYAKEAFLSERRDETIILLRQQLDSGYKANRENMLLRLGQLYAEKYTELSFAENELHGKKLKEYEAKRGNNPKAPRPSLDNTRSKRYLKDAVKIFYSLEKEYPKHPKMDEITFFIGFVEMESGRTAKGMSYLERLLQKYPKSKKYDEAAVFLGDTAFEKYDFKKALQRYSLLAKKTNSPLFFYSQYKIGWCEMNTGKAGSGLNRMKYLVSTLQGSEDKSRLSLREQALKDLVLFYAEAGTVQSAFSYFSSVQGDEKAVDNLKLLADIMASKGRDDQAAIAYRQLLDHYGDSIEAPRIEGNLYEIQSRLGNSKKSVGDLVNALQKYGLAGEWVTRFPADKQAEAKEASETMAQMAEKSALFFHNSAQNSSNKANYNYALKLYTAILINYPNYSNKKKLAFYQAEILFAQERWADATESYMYAAKIPPKDKMNDEAVYNALLALDRLTARTDKIDRLSKEQMKTADLTPQEIPPHEKKFMEVGNYYIQEYPQGQRVVDVKFRIAAIYYRFHHYDEALKHLNAIAINHASHRTATTAAHLVLDIHNIKKDYGQLETSAALFLNTKFLGDKKFKDEMKKIAGEINFKKLEGLERDNKWTEAGDAYYQFYKVNPNADLAEKSLYNAYVSYERGENRTKQTEVAELFLKKYPKSDYGKKMILGLAKQAEVSYDFEQAQRNYEKFFKQYGSDKEALKAHYNAAVFAEILQQDNKAIELYDSYLKEKGITKADQRAIWISKAKIYRRTGRWDKVDAIYHQLASEARNGAERLDYLGELARLYERAGKTAERNRVAAELKRVAQSVGKGKAAGVAAKYVAEAEFQTVNSQRDKFDNLKLKFPPETLISGLKAKEKLLTRLAGQYDQVVSLGVPEWGVAALYEKGALYDKYVESFRAVKVPNNFKEEEKKEAEEALKGIDAKLIAPLQAKAQDIFKVCVDKAAEFQVVNEFVGKCQSRMKGGAAATVNGILPQPAYWSTRVVGEVANRD